MKFEYQTLIGVLGGGIAALFGGWDVGLTILVILMMADYISGLAVAAIFKKSPKSKTGALESRAGWKGLCRKGMTLLLVLIACKLDEFIGTDFIRDAVVIGYIANEGISLMENAGLMGVKMNPTLKKAFDILSRKGDVEGAKLDKGEEK